MMGNKKFPLVSVAIITYNQKEFLRRCLDSIVDQDYPNIEIVVSDDGSTDGTEAMLRKYSATSVRPFVLRFAEENMGITKNSNQAHFACTGKYIAWMGGDDLMLPGKISSQVRYMEANPNCSICYHDLDVFDSGSDATLYFLSKKVKPRNGDIRIYIKHGCFNGACSSMVRRSETPLSGFNELLPVASDWLYWVESLSSGGTIDYIDRVLGRYRRHEENVTRAGNAISQNAIDHLNSCNLILLHYPEYLIEAYFVLGTNLRGLRHKLPYLSSLRITLSLKGWDLKAALGIVCYVFTFGRKKL